MFILQCKLKTVRVGVSRSSFPKFGPVFAVVMKFFFAIFLTAEAMKVDDRYIRSCILLPNPEFFQLHLETERRQQQQAVKNHPTVRLL